MVATVLDSGGTRSGMLDQVSWLVKDHDNNDEERKKMISTPDDDDDDIDGSHY